MKALLIIDVQNDYFPGGASELVGAENALHNISSILKEFREKDMPVIHVQHINTREGATFFLPNTEGVDIHSLLAPRENEPVIVKHFPNSFYETNLQEVLGQMGLTELVVCGMMTHMCIDTTVRAAKDKGIPITLLYDACATKDLLIMGKKLSALDVHNAYMAGLNGMFANVITTNQLVL